MEITDKQYAAVKRLISAMEEASGDLLACYGGWLITKSSYNRSQAAVTRILKAFPEFAAKEEA